MTDTEKLRAVIHENNALRKRSDRLRAVEGEVERLKEQLERANVRALLCAQNARHWKGRDEHRAKNMPHLLDNEWNAATEASAGVLDLAYEGGMIQEKEWVDLGRCIRALKREAK